MYFSLPQLFVFLFDLLSVAVFVIKVRFVKKRRKKADLRLNLYPCVIRYYLILCLLLLLYRLGKTIVVDWTLDNKSSPCFDHRSSVNIVVLPS